MEGEEVVQQAAAHSAVAAARVGCQGQEAKAAPRWAACLQWQWNARGDLVAQLASEVTDYVGGEAQERLRMEQEAGQGI